MIDSDPHVTAKPERAALTSFLVWLAKVTGAAALGGVTAAFTFYTTFMGMQNDVQAQGETLRVHTVQIGALQASDAAQSLADARADAKNSAERESDKEQLRQIREDLQYLQRALIGRIRQP